MHRIADKPPTELTMYACLYHSWYFCTPSSYKQYDDVCARTHPSRVATYYDGRAYGYEQGNR